MAATILGALGAVVSCAVAAAADDRLLFIGSVSHIPNSTGARDWQAHWLHDRSTAAKFSAGIESHSSGDARWTLGSVSGAFIHNTTAMSPRQYGLLGEFHQGSGNDTTHSFNYQVIVGGLSYALTPDLTLQLEERYINVDATRGHLPKVGLAYTADRHWLTTMFYAHSASGNLGTELVGARLDIYQPAARLLAGVSFGKSSPAVVNLQPTFVAPGLILREEYFGAAWQVLRGELLLVTDFLDLGGSRRETLTMSYTVHLVH